MSLLSLHSTSTEHLAQGHLLELQVWRLLAETQMLQGDAAAAAASYQTADSKAGGGGIELLSAWTDALVAAGKPQKVKSKPYCCSAGCRSP